MAVYLFVKRLLSHAVTGHAHRGEDIRRPGPGQADEMVQDPCCKVYVPKSRAITSRSGGETHSFCSEECAKKYADSKCG